uniref:Zinc-binding domain-containing protein n=1 Tax=viral metagenome TaxID=1070528 RepID=A0A6M3ILT8_9ZZZZ
MTYITLLQVEPYPNLQKDNKRNKHLKFYGRDNLFLCQKCNKPWQSYKYKTMHQNWEYLWEGFPKIGCKAKTCPDCRTPKELKCRHK